MPNLNINAPQVLKTLGFHGAIAEGHRFSLTVRNWPADVLAQPMTRSLSDGDTMHFAAKNEARASRPALVLDQKGVHITMNPGPQAAVLAEAFGIDFDSEAQQ